MPTWVTPALIIAALCGGLGGAVFTWLRTRDPRARVGYVIATITTGADPTVKSLIPDLVIRIGDEIIPAIHTHVIDLHIISGYSASAEIAVILPGKPMVFGYEFTPPSPMHKMPFQIIPEGFKCVMSPLERKFDYRISIAGEFVERPKVITAGRDMKLLPLDEVSDTDKAGPLWATAAVAIVAVTLLESKFEAIAEFIFKLFHQ